MTANRHVDRRSTLTEAVDPRSGAIRVRGTVTAGGARALGNTVETLRRGGHARVVLHLGDAEHVDEDGLAVLHTLRERIREEGGTLHIFGEPCSDVAPPESTSA